MLSMVHEAPAASPAPNEPTKEELFTTAKAAVDAGEQSMREAAEALATAQQLYSVSQAEMACVVGKSEAWVSRLLKWRRSGYREQSPFGPTTKAARLAHAKDRISAREAKPRKLKAQGAAKADEAAHDDNDVPVSTAADTLPTTVDLRTSSDDELLGNFKYAVDIWLPRMSEEAARQAVAYVIEKAGARPS
jgi:hypothetical protein